MARKHKQSFKYTLIPLIEIEDKKLDHRAIRCALLDSRDCATAAFHNFGFGYADYRFEERNPTQIYELYCKIGIYEADYCFIYGEKGLYLKIPESVPYNEVTQIIKNNQNFIDFCKCFLFKPIGVAHWSDGDSYIIDSNDDQIRACSNVEMFANEGDDNADDNL